MDCFTKLVADDSSNDPTDVGSRTPIILIHGIHGNLTNTGDDPQSRTKDEYFEKLIFFLKNSNPAFIHEYKIYRFHYKSDYLPIYQISRSLRNRIDDLVKQNSQLENKKFVLIAHSMGGLVARSYMNEHDTDYGPTFQGKKGGERISKLIALATPHHGTYGANDKARISGHAVWGVAFDADDLVYWEWKGGCPDCNDDPSHPNRSDLRYDNFDGLWDGNPAYTGDAKEQNAWLRNLPKTYDRLISAYYGYIGDNAAIRDVGQKGPIALESYLLTNPDEYSLQIGSAVLLARIELNNFGIPPIDSGSAIFFANNDGLVPVDSGMYKNGDVGLRVQCAGYNHGDMKDGIGGDCSVVGAGIRKPLFALIRDELLTGPNYEGYIERADCDSISGWAANRSQLNTVMNVVLYDGATQITTAPADALRTDVGGYIHDNGLHGFTIPIPANLKNGAAHTLSVRIEGSNTFLLNADNPATHTRTLTCTTGPNYEGYIDRADCDSISGWAANRNQLNTALNVVLYDGATQVTTVTANALRTDVGGYIHDNGLHGFTIPIPANLKNGAAHTLSIRIEGTNTFLPNANNTATNTRTLTCTTGPNYEGYIDRADCESISGWGADRNRLNTVLNVTLYDGATPLTTVPANALRSDVGGYIHDNGLHGFTIPIPASLKNGVAHTLSVKFEGTNTSLLNANNTSTTTRTLTCTTDSNYEGYVDRADCDSISGWGADRNRLNQVVNVTLYDGSTPLTTVPANGLRTDVGSYIHDNGLHGFTIPIPASLKNGVAHTLSVKFEGTNTFLVNANNTSTNTRTLTCTTTSSPQVNSVNPNPLPLFNANQSLQVSGINFQANLTIDVFNSSGTKVGTLSGPGQVQSVTPNSFTMVVFLGSSAGTFGIEVINPDGGRSPRFTFPAVAPNPSVNSLNPNPLSLFNANQSVQVFGNNFQTNLTVDVFNSSGTKIGTLSGSAQVQNVTPNSFTMVVFLGSSAATFGIEVVNPNGGRSPRFTLSAIAPNPSVNSINPNPVPVFNGNQSVQVFGNNFQTNLTVDVFNSGGTKVGTLSGSGQVQSVTPNSFTMVISLGGSAGTFGIEVVNPNGGRSARFTFPY